MADALSDLLALINLQAEINVVFKTQFLGLLVHPVSNQELAKSLDLFFPQ